MNIKEKKFLDFRRTFPAYSQAIYMNHAAVSPLSKNVRDILTNYWEKRSHIPVDVYPSIMDTIEELKKMICEMIHAKNSNEIAIIPNTSSGLNIIASGLKWEKGDRIILNTMEFPANVYPFMNLEKRGVIIDWVKPVNGKIQIKEIRTLVTNRTRLLSISFVQFLNGFKADLGAIGKLCKQKDIWFVVDGIQGVGAIPVDVVKCNIDAFASGGHKWLMWPMGTGFLYTNRKLLSSIEPTYAGWLSVKNSWDFFDYKLNFLDTAEKFQPGTLNFIGLIAAHKMLSTFLELKIENIFQRILSLTDILLHGLNKLSIKIITPEHKSLRSGIISIELPDPEKTFNELYANHIFVALREGVIRFSIHCTNTIEDIEKVLQCLKKII